MLNDGLLGNKSILLALSSLTTGNLNSKLKKDAKPYRMEDVLPLAYSYIVPELTEEEKPRAFYTSTVPKRLTVLGAGSFLHIFLGFFL